MIYQVKMTLYVSADSPNNAKARAMRAIKLGGQINASRDIPIVNGDDSPADRLRVHRAATEPAHVMGVLAFALDAVTLYDMGQIDQDMPDDGPGGLPGEVADAIGRVSRNNYAVARALPDCTCECVAYRRQTGIDYCIASCEDARRDRRAAEGANH
jgi:hypothetical protein